MIFVHKNKNTFQLQSDVHNYDTRNKDHIEKTFSDQKNLNTLLYTLQLFCTMFFLPLSSIEQFENKMKEEKIKTIFYLLKEFVDCISFEVFLLFV